MKGVFFYLVCLLSLQVYGQSSFNGFFQFSWDEDKGIITLEVPQSKLGSEFLYVQSLSAGIGSNDIGLDRGQLGARKIVKFIRIGKKLLLIQPNLRYRAISSNPLERTAVEEAFAQSVIWGFDIKDIDEVVLSIDITKFLLRDAHGVADRLKSSKQGSYKVDSGRSAIWMDRTNSFPENTEFESLLTFVGDAKGAWIRSVTPTSKAITVRQHHSFIKLPDSDYKPRKFHPYSGYNQFSFYDYSSPIETSLIKRFIVRHRLEKKDPNGSVSEAVEPIIYYLDPGCPEPIKSALLEGAAWWDQAFQAAGYTPGTFQVSVLPEGADMMDVRYNVIQWVHRSTRGWSYGASVVDPRTGEIIKGHVSLGSLRVRQDILIAQGILSPFYDNEDSSPMRELALARLRQLAAHEVGHTLGLAHNFAASHNDRSSVMDYPHPRIVLKENGDIDLSGSYDDKIGEWDKRTISYGYQDFPAGTVEDEALDKMLLKTQEDGFLFLSDRDARPEGGAHPFAHLWDDGKDAVGEFGRLLELRRDALHRFGESSIIQGTPLSELEKVLVPLYLMHRYQMEAVSKLVGGIDYQYFVKGDAYEHNTVPVSHNLQGRAIQVILQSLSAAELKLPEHIIRLIPPPAQGYRRDRETFSGRTNLGFDPMSPAESYANTAISFLLNKDRLTRIERFNVTGQSPMRLSEVLDQISTHLFTQRAADSYSKALNELVQKIFFIHLLKTSYDVSVDAQVAAATFGALSRIQDRYLQKELENYGDHEAYLSRLFAEARNHPENLKLPELKSLPPGSPIGCGYTSYLN